MRPRRTRGRTWRRSWRPIVARRARRPRTAYGPSGRRAPRRRTGWGAARSDRDGNPRRSGCKAWRLRSGEVVGAGDVAAQDGVARRIGHRRDHLLQLLEVVAGMIRMRVVAGPEEAVLADQLHHGRDRPLVRIGGDVALTLEVVRRLLAKPYGGPERGPAEDGVGSVEEVADPAGLRLQHHHVQARESIEDPELEEGGEGLHHAVPGEEVEVPHRPAELVVAVVYVPGGRLEGGMDRERHVEVLRGCEDRVVRGRAVRDARDGEGADEGAAAAVEHRALELARRLGRIAQREVRNGNQSTAGVAAEVGDPAVVGAAVRAGQLGVHQLGFPEQPDRGVEDRLRHALAIQQLDALLHVHGAERGPAEVGLLRPRADPAHLLGTDLAAHRPLAQLPRLVDPLAHAAQCAQLAGAGQGGSPAVDLQVFIAVVADPDPDGTGPVAGLEVLLPEIGRLEDVPVAINDHREGYNTRTDEARHLRSIPVPDLAGHPRAVQEPARVDAEGRVHRAT